MPSCWNKFELCPAVACDPILFTRSLDASRRVIEDEKTQEDRKLCGARLNEWGQVPNSKVAEAMSADGSRYLWL